MITFQLKKCSFILFVLVGLNISSNFVLAQASDRTAVTMTKPVVVNPDIDFMTNQFSLSGKAGLLLTTGNTDSFTANAILEAIYRMHHVENTLSAGGLYTNVYSTQSGSGEGLSAQYLYSIYRMDYYLSQLSTVYGGTGLYVDKIRGVESAYQFFGGLSKYLIKEEGVATTLRVSGGYNFTHENRVAPEPDDDIHSFVQGANLNHIITENTDVTWDVMLMENIEDLTDTRINSDLALTIKMTKVFSLVLGWRVRFDNQPVSGFGKFDMIQDLSLGMKF